MVIIDCTQMESTATVIPVTGAPATAPVWVRRCAAWTLLLSCWPSDSSNSSRRLWNMLPRSPAGRHHAGTYTVHTQVSHMALNAGSLQGAERASQWRIYAQSVAELLSMMDCGHIVQGHIVQEMRRQIPGTSFGYTSIGDALLWHHHLRQSGGRLFFYTTLGICCEVQYT